MPAAFPRILLDNENNEQKTRQMTYSFATQLSWPFGIYLPSQQLTVMKLCEIAHWCVRIRRLLNGISGKGNTEPSKGPVGERNARPECDTG